MIKIPWESGKKYIRSGHGNPTSFDRKSYRTITISKGKGIMAIVACPRGKYVGGRCKTGTRVVSYLFAKAKGWTMSKAKSWYKSHKKEAIEISTKPKEIKKIETQKEEKWTRAYINDLPDSAFAYIEPGGKKDKTGRTVPRGKRHLPFKNKEGQIHPPHLRNALARLPQTHIGSGAKAKARAKLCGAVRSYNKTHPKQKISSGACKITKKDIMTLLKTDDESEESLKRKLASLKSQRDALYTQESKIYQKQWQEIDSQTQKIRKQVRSKYAPQLKELNKKTSALSSEIHALEHALGIEIAK